jgi:hypothetical protein
MFVCHIQQMSHDYKCMKTLILQQTAPYKTSCAYGYTVRYSALYLHLCLLALALVVVVVQYSFSLRKHHFTRSSLRRKMATIV